MRSKTFEDLLTRIRGEYKEMPGLRLTPEQGGRLWGLEREQSEELLHMLAVQGFLVIGLDGKYRRPADNPEPMPHQTANSALTDPRTALEQTPATRRAGGGRNH